MFLFSSFFVCLFVYYLGGGVDIPGPFASWPEKRQKALISIRMLSVLSHQSHVMDYFQTILPPSVLFLS